MQPQHLQHKIIRARMLIPTLSILSLMACGGSTEPYTAGPSARAESGPTTATPTASDTGSADATTATPSNKAVLNISRKKGLGTWYFAGGDKALADFQGSWFYNWSPEHTWITPPAGVEFLPMIWSSADVTTAKLTAAKASGSALLLGFNEPDNKTQANMTTTQALDLWPKLMATGMPLCSPAPANDPVAPGGWLDSFMNGVASRGYRVDKICVHWYGNNFDPTTATGQLRSVLQATYDKYKRPILLTEFNLTNWSAWGTAGQFPSASVEAEFLRQSTAMLESLPFVERYAWFSAPKYTSNPAETSFLYQNDGTPTTVGQAYRAVGKSNTQLLKNPGFETGTLGEWSVWENHAGTTYVDSTGSMEGQFHAGQTVNGATQSYLYQGLLVANGNYSASCSLKGKASQGLYFGVKKFNSGNMNAQQSVRVENTGAYTRFTLEPINVTSGYMEIFTWFDAALAGDFAMIDGCEVHKLP